MDVNGGRSSISGGSSCNNNNNNNTNIGAILHHHDSGSEDDQMMMMMEDLRRGPWTVEEDLTLMSYITNHGEGRWNSLARLAGLKRTGKSCRLRWLNYLRPDVRRGNITLEEQLLILELHSRWGNRWSKIAQHLPGRTDNEIKNYWRTRVQKHAKQLKCDVNSKQFKDTMRYLWMPRLVERIQAASASGVTGDSSGNSGGGHHFNNGNININDNNNDNNNNNIGLGQLVHVPATGCTIGSDYGGGAVPQVNNNPRSSYTNDLENSISTAASSDSFGAQVSPVSDLTDNYNNFPGNYNPNPNYFQAGQVGYTDSLISPSGYYNNNNSQGIDFQSMEQNNQWSVDGGADVSDNLWNVEDIWFLQQQFTNTI